MNNPYDFLILNLKKDVPTHDGCCDLAKCKTISACSIERWKRAFDIVRLENELINHRMTSLLATNGFLFAGLYFLFNAYFDTNRHPKLYYFIIISVNIIVDCLGLFASFATGKGVRAASRQIKAAATWLTDYDIPDENCIKYPPYPPIIGIRASFIMTYIDVIKKVILQILSLRQSPMSVIKDKSYKDYYKIPTRKDDDYMLNYKEADDILSMSAGIIYLPNALFLCWLLLLVHGLYLLCSYWSVA